jgi:hypothetical protein
MDWNPYLIHKQLFKDEIGKTRILSIPGVPFHENGNIGLMVHSCTHSSSPYCRSIKILLLHRLLEE